MSIPNSQTVTMRAVRAVGGRDTSIKLIYDENVIERSRQMKEGKLKMKQQWSHAGSYSLLMRNGEAECCLIE